MNAGQTFLIVGAAIALASVASVAVIVITKFRRGRVGARDRAMLAPYRHALVAMAAGEDEDRQAQAALCAVQERIWALLRPSVIAFLPKVRGVTADNLSHLMRSHGEIDEARRMLTSPSAVRRARASYLLGLVRDYDSVALLLPLLGDPAADVRLVTTRALGVIGDPLAASGVLLALRTKRGDIGLPAWVAAEALLAMGAGIWSALQIGLASDDAGVRNVCAVVAGHGPFLAAAPRLRGLLATDRDGDVRASAAAALGRMGGADDVASLARHTDVSEIPVLRRTCATALGDLGCRESLEILVGLLGDDDRRLAELAADSLVRIGPEGIASLEEATAPAPGLSALAAVGALELARLRGELVVARTGSR